MVRKKLGRGRKNRCRFCTKEGCPRPAFVDYKDVQGLKKLCTSQGKLFSRKRSGNCAAFQRAVKDAAKVNGTILDLDRELPAGNGEISFQILTDKDREALDVVRHSCAHVMARAV